jgi:dihydrofolate synthase/folylpolyglutamate synthase
MLCGMMRRKDAAAFFKPLAPHIRHLLTIPISGEACYDPQELAAIARAIGISNVSSCITLQEAIVLLKAETTAALLVVGSLFLAGEILKNHG